MSNIRILRVITFSVLTLLFSCTKNEVKNTNKIVFVLDSSVQKRKLILTFCDRDKITNTLWVRNGDKKIIITNASNFNDIIFSGDGILQTTFCLEGGDSVLLTLRDRAPTISILNRDFLKYDENYEALASLHLRMGNPQAIDDYVYLSQVLNDPASGIGRDSSLLLTLQQVKQRVQTEIVEENLFIDSLEKNNLISPRVGRFFKSRNLFVGSTLDFQKNGKINFADHNVITSLFSAENSKSLIGHVFFQHTLNDYQNYLTKSKSTKHKIQVYDSISRSNAFDSITMASLKYKLADQFYDELSESEKQIVNKVLLKDFSENVLNKLFENHPIIDILSEDFTFTQSNKQLITGDHVKLQSKGKFIYVNLWASWCLPCISEIPELKMIQNNFSDNLSVVYLSIDKDQKTWGKATSIYLNNYGNSYYLDSLAKQQLWDIYKLNSIPRYILLDRNGDLIHNNAPRPGMRELLNLIEVQ
ncbi:MAG: TlpA family protein disulfide reductase [Cyclobacteriaceae bacterium]|nr:TlpA family protein disulfide reductase [Cyclobacteriaceae bacterium]